MAELVTLRRTRGLSQRELAERAKVSPATVYEMEAGRRPQPRGSTLRKLAEALGVDVSELVEDFYSPKDSSLLTPERALKMPRERFAAEIKGAETEPLHKLLGALVGDDLPRTRKDLKAGRREAIPEEAFSRALEVRAELIERGEKSPESQLPAFKKRLEVLHLG
jgi:transcriptional regulator with XRE-family HTH domain